MSLVTRNEIPVKVTKITSRISVSWTHSLCDFDLFLIQWNDHKPFIGSNSPNIRALCEKNLNDSIDSGNFSVRGYLPLNRKASVTYMHGLAVYVKEGFRFRISPLFVNKVLFVQKTLCQFSPFNFRIYPSTSRKLKSKFQWKSRFKIVFFGDLQSWAYIVICYTSVVNMLCIIGISIDSSHHRCQNLVSTSMVCKTLKWLRS